MTRRSNVIDQVRMGGWVIKIAILFQGGENHTALFFWEYSELGNIWSPKFCEFKDYFALIKLKTWKIQF